MVLLLVLVLGVSVVQSALKTCSPRSGGALQRTVRRVDQLEMVETVLFTFGLTLSWRVIFDLWEQGQSTLGLAKTAVALASLLFVVQLTTLAKYALNIRALVTGRSFGRFANLSHERLRLRLSFLTERFGTHAPYWQYVIWLRQFLLTLDVWICQLVMSDRDHVRGGGVAVCHSVDLAADDGAAANGTANATADGAAACRTLTNESLSAVYTHAAFAMLIFVVFGALQAIHKPFAYDFQNHIEAWLFAANVALVGLGTVYTALRVEGEANGGVEALCITLLVCSLVAAAGFMVYNSRQTHLARRRQLAKSQNPSEKGVHVAAKADESPRSYRRGGGSRGNGDSSRGDSSHGDGSHGDGSLDGDELGDLASLANLKAAPRGVAALRRAARGAAAATALSRIGAAAAASQHEPTEDRGTTSCGALVMAGDCGGGELVDDALHAGRRPSKGRVQMWRPGRVPANKAAADAAAAAGDEAAQTPKRATELADSSTSLASGPTPPSSRASRASRASIVSRSSILSETSSSLVSTAI